LTQRPINQQVPTPSPLRRTKHVPSAIVELERPVAEVKGNIGRERQSQKTREQQEDLLAEVFERVANVHGLKTVQEGLSFLLDLALEKIPAESGSVLIADAGSGDLSFSVARGPKADDLLKAKITLPSGSGIAGFCTTEGVSVALSDVQKDPRHYSAVADRVSYEPRSLLCSPMMVQGRSFGAMQIINRAEDTTFTEYDIGLLAYIAHQAAVFLSHQ
jgi:GAF domain-containing protein